MKKKETTTQTTPTEGTQKAKRTTRTRKKTEQSQPAVESQNTTATEIRKEEKPAEKPIRKRAIRKKQAEPQETPEKPKAAPAQEIPTPDVTPTQEDAQSSSVGKQETPAPVKAEKAIEVPVQRPQKPITIPPMQDIKVRDFCDLSNAGGRIPILGEQQIQMLTWEEAQRRCEILERVLVDVLDYDIVLSDTNIWLELLVGHSSSHSDPRVGARLMFERQLESLSKMMKRIGGRFMVMSETYEEIDRFASAQEPVNYKDADWTDESLCRNVAARLAKRLMLVQQKENRLRIEGIGSESQPASFADPAIIRRTVEFFANGKKVLLLTNDTSVGIRSLGMCDDLQRINDIDDETWRTTYEPQRPMVLTMDDLKLLDTYTRQYYFLCAAAGRAWMQDASQREPVILQTPLQLWLEGFRPGIRHERHSERKEQERHEQGRRNERERAEKDAHRKANQEAAAQQNTDKQNTDTAKPATEPEPIAEPPEKADVPSEEKKSRRRGGRGRRGGKKNEEKTAN